MMVRITVALIMAVLAGFFGLLLALAIPADPTWFIVFGAIAGFLGSVLARDSG